MHEIPEVWIEPDERRLTYDEYMDYWRFAKANACAVPIQYSEAMIIGQFMAVTKTGTDLSVNEVLQWPTTAWSMIDVLFLVFKREFLRDDTLHVFSFWCWDAFVVPRMSRIPGEIEPAVERKYRYVVNGTDYDELNTLADLREYTSRPDIGSLERAAGHVVRALAMKDPLTFGRCTIWGLLSSIPMFIREHEVSLISHPVMSDEWIAAVKTIDATVFDRVYIEMIMYLRSHLNVTSVVPEGI